jgi:pimeloyl-ACP methyl ester carboxylesterase
MHLELISIPTDTHALDGLFYTPAGTPKGAALFFHGNCMNFYTGPARMVPPALVEAGYACLAFNRRGHDMIATLNSRAVTGGAFQMTKEAIADNRYAAQWLVERGFPHPILIGHSNGGMLAMQHVADHPETPALVLLSAHLGGASIVPLASKAGLLGGDRIAEVEAQARRMVAEGRGGELMLLPGWWHVITADSYLDYGSQLPMCWPSRRRSNARSFTSAATRSRRISIRRKDSPSAPVGRATCASWKIATTSMAAGRIRLPGSSPAGCKTSWRKLDLAQRLTARHTVDRTTAGKRLCFTGRTTWHCTAAACSRDLARPRFRPSQCRGSRARKLARCGSASSP